MEYRLITRKGNKITDQEATRVACERIVIVFSVACNLDYKDFLKKLRNNEPCTFHHNDGDFEFTVIAK